MLPSAQYQSMTETSDAEANSDDSDIDEIPHKRRKLKI
jgi:hypothetical protein